MATIQILEDIIPAIPLLQLFMIPRWNSFDCQALDLGASVFYSVQRAVGVKLNYTQKQGLPYLKNHVNMQLFGATLLGVREVLCEPWWEDK